MNKMRRYLGNVKRTMQKTALAAKWKLRETSGEGYVDTAIKILIAVVLGALLLAGLYSLFQDTVLPTLVQRVKDMFDYAG